MLVVGTRGRSLGGIQSLMATRNSFSKYCLQYCPVPVVVVRPTEKRERKKSKRMHDEGRQTYAKMLPGGKHEADSEANSMYELEVRLPQDEEAHEIARALGLPAAFDPTIKPINPAALLHPRYSAPAVLAQTVAIPRQTKTETATTVTTVLPDDSGDDSGEESGEGEFETFTGEQALESQKKDKLHKMEMNEAAALLKQNRGGLGGGVADEEDDEEDAGATTPRS